MFVPTFEILGLIFLRNLLHKFPLSYIEMAKPVRRIEKEITASCFSFTQYISALCIQNLKIGCYRSQKSGTKFFIGKKHGLYH